MKQQFIEDKVGTIRLTVYDSNRAIVPSSGNIVLYDPSGGVIQASTSVSINSTTGEMTYSLTTIHTQDRGLNYKAVWEYVFNGVTYYETQLFDIVRSILSIPITDDDIYSELDSLRKSNNQATGTATSATSSTLVDTAKRKEPDDFWKGGTIEIIAGTGSGQMRDITGSVQSSGTISVTPNFTTTPDSTSSYRVVKSYAVKIAQAFNKIETMLYNKGNRDNLILESSQIELPLLFLTIHHICLDLRDEENDKWGLLARDYNEKFNDAFKNMRVDYDVDDSGTISGDEEEQKDLNSFNIFRS